MTEAVIEKKKVTERKLKPPKRYNVVICNDDVTPMEFVVQLLMTIFRHSEQSSVAIMLKIHQEGSAIAGVYTFEIAEQKGIDATTLARSKGYPLVIRLEEE